MLSQKDTLYLIGHPDAAGQQKGAFLCFLMIPIIERLGVWRFAGSATDLGGALLRVGELLVHFSCSMGQDPGAPLVHLQETLESAGEVLEYASVLAPGWSDDFSAHHPVGDVRGVILAEGGAPYDDFGICIVQVSTLTGHPLAEHLPEDQIPQEWTDREPD